jgi:hypothetical protein
MLISKLVRRSHAKCCWVMRGSCSYHTTNCGVDGVLVCYFDDNTNHLRCIQHPDWQLSQDRYTAERFMTTYLIFYLCAEGL